MSRLGSWCCSGRSGFNIPEFLCLVFLGTVVTGIPCISRITRISGIPVPVVRSSYLCGWGLLLTPILFGWFSCKQMNFRTLDLSIEFYRQVERLRLPTHLRDQLFRAAASISLNLAEGNGKQSGRDKKRFYQTAYASTQECKTILKLANCSNKRIVDDADKLGAWIYKLLKSDISTI